MKNEKFLELNEKELHTIQGGCDPLTIATLLFTVIGAAATVVGTSVTVYQSNKADAYDAGKKAAYEDMRGK